MRVKFLIAVVLILFLGSSCSGRNPISPEPQNLSIDPTPDSFLLQYENANTNGLFGMYNVSVDSNAQVYFEPFVSRESLLGEQYLGEITAFLTSMYCSNCARVEGITLSDDNKINLTIGVKHPFKLPTGPHATAINRLDLHLFDVIGMIVTPDGVSYPSVGVILNQDFVLNADGYSGIFDSIIDGYYPTVNNIHPYKVFFENSTQGNFDPTSTTTGFTDPIAPSGHNVFPQGSGYNSVTYRLNITAGQSVNFILALTGSYGSSAKYGIQEGSPGNRLTPRYFLPRFNRHEAWKINVSVPDYMNFLTSGNPDPTAEIRIDAWDWQDGVTKSSSWNFFTSQAGEISLKSDIKRVIVSVPYLMETPIILDATSGTGRSPRKFTAYIKNALQAPAGKYPGLVCVVDDLDGAASLLGIKRDGKTPFLYSTIRTWQYFTVDVKSNSTAIPNNPIDVTPKGLNGICNDVIVSGNLAFVAMGILGVTVLDLTTPASPVFLGSIDTYGRANRLAYSSEDKLLYVADGSAGLAIISMANPSSPVMKGTFDYTGINNACDVAINGDYAYLGDSSNGIAIINVYDPTLPHLENFYNSRPKVRALCADNGYLYKLDDVDGIEIISFENPSELSLVNGLFVVGTKRDIHVRNGVAAICLSDRLVTADVSNPSAPLIKGSVSYPSEANSVFLNSTKAYVTFGNDGIKVISIEDMMSPIITHEYDTPGTAHSSFTVSPYTIVADGDSGVMMLRFIDNQLTLSGKYLTAGQAPGVVIGENNVFIATGNSGVKSVEIFTPESAHITGFANTPGFAWDCDLRDDALYVADFNKGLAVVSISNPSNPIYLGNKEFDSWQGWRAWGIKTRNNHVALWGPQTDGEYPDLILLDATNKLSPVQIGSVATSRDFFDVTFIPGYIFAAAGAAGIATIDVSNPASPQFVGVYNNGKLSISLDYYNNNIYAMFQENGIEILDATTPKDLIKIGGKVTAGVALDIDISGKYAYTSNNQGLLILDVSDLSSPMILANHPVQDTVYDITVRGNYAYVAANEAGLRIFKLW